MCKPRKLSIDPSEIQIVHTWNRCVRRAFLCGYDSITNRDLEHRRQWIRERIEFLASIFGIDIVTFAILSNHFHQVLRSRPDIVRDWSDEEVALRTMRLAGKQWFRPDGTPRKSATAEVARRTNDPKRMQELRARLSDISWWMKYLDQDIARRANFEDDVKGSFWEARFGSEVLTSEASVLRCMIYVDLNPIRANIATSPEDSDFTGIQERVNDLRFHLITTATGDTKLSLSMNELQTHDWERLDNEKSGWLAPIEIDEQHDALGAHPASNKRRASDKGFLPFSLIKYLQILNWIGYEDDRLSAPDTVASLLSQVGISPKNLLIAVKESNAITKRYFEATERNGTLSPKPRKGMPRSDTNQQILTKWVETATSEP